MLDVVDASATSRARTDSVAHAGRNRYLSVMIVAALLGLCFGYLGSMPIAGPIAILVFERGLEGRRRDGLYIACGSAIVESAYAYLAFWGFSALLERYAWIELASRIAAAVILTAIGIYCFRRDISEGDRSKLVSRHRESKGGSFLLGFTVTAINPTLLATWGATVTTLYSLQIVHFDSAKALPFSIGACVGIVLWFLTLLYLMKRMEHRFTPRSLDRVLNGMGVALIAVGLVLAVRVVVRVLA